MQMTTTINIIIIQTAGATGNLPLGFQKLHHGLQQRGCPQLGLPQRGLQQRRVLVVSVFQNIELQAF